MRGHTSARYFAAWFIFPMAVFVAGCASPTHGYRVTNPVTAGLQDAYLLSLTITSSAEDPSTVEERSRLARETQRRLEQADWIVELVERHKGEMDEGLVLELSVTQLRRVSKARRYWLAAMAGRASIEVHARLFNPMTGVDVGAACIRGSSSGGHMYAGTTDEAIREAAKAIVAFVESSR